MDRPDQCNCTLTQWWWEGQARSGSKLGLTSTVLIFFLLRAASCMSAFFFDISACDHTPRRSGAGASPPMDQPWSRDVCNFNENCSGSAKIKLSALQHQATWLLLNKQRTKIPIDRTHLLQHCLLCLENITVMGCGLCRLLRHPGRAEDVQDWLLPGVPVPADDAGLPWAWQLFFGAWQLATLSARQP